MRYTHGGIGFRDLWDMPLDRYDKIVKAVNASIRDDERRQKQEQKKLK